MSTALGIPWLLLVPAWSHHVCSSLLALPLVLHGGMGHLPLLPDFTLKCPRGLTFPQLWSCLLLVYLRIPLFLSFMFAGS